MSAPLPLNSLWALAASLVLALSPCLAHADAAPDSLLEYRTTAQTHGLYEIREEAIRFLDHEAQKKKDGWRALDPDIRIQVDKCAVPLKSRWVQKSIDFPYPTIEVSCATTIDKRHPKWTVAVPVYTPVEKNRTHVN